MLTDHGIFLIDFDKNLEMWVWAREMGGDRLLSRGLRAKHLSLASPTPLPPNKTQAVRVGQHQLQDDHSWVS